MFRKLIYLVTVVIVLGLAGMASAEEGLIGEYYHEGPDDVWDDLVMVRLDPTVDFGWGDGSPEPGVVNANNFKVRWTGEVEIPSTGTWTFYTQTDDGVRLWVNDVLVLENWTDHGSTQDSGEISLQGGQRYPIKLEWYENGGGALCHLSWEGPTMPRQIIPSGYLWVGGDRPNAHNPTPADGTLFRETWQTLSWVPGDFASSHDVYIGENYDEVEAGTGDTFKGNQAEVYFTVGFPGFPFPDGLVKGTTYYWRVDEVEADGTTKYEGDIWSFSIAPKTIYNAEPADGAEAVDTDIRLSWEPGFGAILHYVYFGDDFDTVSNAAGGMPSGANNYTPGTLEAGKVYYWRVDAFHGFETHPSEVMSFSTPGGVSSLDPSNGSENVNQKQILTWAAGDSSASYEVYFGTDKDAVRSADTGSPEYKGSKTIGSESYDPGTMEWNSDYYWRVDEVKADGTIQKGMIWRYTTADFLVVDDFESYNEIDEGMEGSNRIYNAWVDGYDDPTNGSQAGHLDPPFYEDTIVHSGNKSMPLYYDNAVGKSEVTLTLTYPRDWTEKGIDTLTIWFRGASANTLETLYVAL
ncbi:MAG: PA14 domain-containing protein, partial [Planctomycetota bacterium]